MKKFNGKVKFFLGWRFILAFLYLVSFTVVKTIQNSENVSSENLPQLQVFQSEKKTESPEIASVLSENIISVNEKDFDIEMLIYNTWEKASEK